MHMVEAMRVTADETLHEPRSLFRPPLPPGPSPPPPRIRSPVGVGFGVFHALAWLSPRRLRRWYLGGSKRRW